MKENKTVFRDFGELFGDSNTGKFGSFIVSKFCFDHFTKLVILPQRYSLSINRLYNVDCEQYSYFD